jgi:hypothetical protein
MAIKPIVRFFLLILLFFGNRVLVCKPSSHDKTILPTGSHGARILAGRAFDVEAFNRKMRGVSINAAPQTKEGHLGTLTQQLNFVQIPSFNSVITLAPSNDVLDDKYSATPSRNGSNIKYVVEHPLGRCIEKIIPAGGASALEGDRILLNPEKRLTAGLELEWAKGQIGTAAFASAENVYNDYQYWLVKGPHRDGDRFNFPAESLLLYGPDSSLRLENTSRKGNLAVTNIKSPYSKMFENTLNPNIDKYSIVNLAGSGTGIGSASDNWYFLTMSGDRFDTSINKSGIPFLLKGAYVTLKSNIAGNFRALAMPVYARDSDPCFGIGIKIGAEDWTTARRGPAIWEADLAADTITAVGGTVTQGGLQGSIMQNLAVYVWGASRRAYLKHDNLRFCIDTHKGKPRSWLDIPDGWMRVTEQHDIANTFFQWPGDGENGVGRVSSRPSVPHLDDGIDIGLSAWTGSTIFRFSVARMKGGPWYHPTQDFGALMAARVSGVDFVSGELPWAMPKIKGAPDGSFDPASGVKSVFEVSARGGDVATTASGAVVGTTLWRVKDIYPLAVVQRAAGRGDVDAISKLKKFFNLTVPEFKPFVPNSLISEDFSNIKYGATARLRHQESGKYLAVSKVSLPDNSNLFYLTCVSDKAAAGQWMVTPGIGLSARVGGASVGDGDGIRLIDRVTKKTMMSFGANSPLSLNYAVPNIDMLLTPSSAPILRAYDLPAVACTGTPPDEKLDYPSSNWIVSPVFASAAATPPVVGTASSATTPTPIQRGICFQNQGRGGYLSSVNGYMYKSTDASSDWLQEVTVFDAGGTNNTSVGAFGTWALEDVFPAPLAADEMKAAGFAGPMSLVDGRVLNLVQVAVGSDNCIYGVDGLGNAVKVDLAKKTSEQLSTDIKKIVVGTDDAILMLKNDGTVVLRVVGGSDQIISGCMARDIAIGSAGKFAAISADGGVLGHLMLNQGQQLLASSKDALAVDITDDGYVFGLAPIDPSSNFSKLLIAQQSNSSLWKEVSLSVLGERIVRISAGSTRFLVLHGAKGGMWRLAPAVGEQIFANPSVLISNPDLLKTATAWQKFTIDSSGLDLSAVPLSVVDCSVSSDGILCALAGQVSENFDFQVFTMPLAQWPDSTVMFNLKIEATPGVEAVSASSTSPAIAAVAATYSRPLICESENGYLKVVSQANMVQATGGAGQFCLVSADGYVTLQTKSGQSLKTSNVVFGLNKDDRLQNRNLMTAKTKGGEIITVGTSFDANLIQDQLSVGFGGQKFKALNDDASVLEKFMFYAEGASSKDGKIRFKLQSKATGGFLKKDSADFICSIRNVDGKAVAITRAEGSVFVLTPMAATNLKLQQALIGKNPREVMDVLEAAWSDETNFVDGLNSFLSLVSRWVEGLRISPAAWADFTETVSDWTNPVDKLKKSVSASFRLTYLLSDASILRNAFIRQQLSDPQDPTRLRTVAPDELLAIVRGNCDASKVPSNLGIIKNVKDGVVVALRSVFGIDSDGKLTKEKGKIIRDLYLAIDPVRNVGRLSPVTSINPLAQFTMKVVPSPLASARSVDEGRDSSDIQRWMFQASGAVDAATRRLSAPIVGSEVVIDSRDSALGRYVMQWTGLKNSDQSSMLPAYFDVQSVIARSNIGGPTRVVLQSASNGGYLGAGRTDADVSLKVGLPVTDTLDLDLRTQDVIQSPSDQSYSAMPLILAHAAEFEIVIITPVIQQLSDAFKKATFDEQVEEFLVVSSKLEKVIDAITFCDAISAIIKTTIRSSQESWNKYVSNRPAREKLLSCVDNLKRLFSQDYNASASSSKSYIDGLFNTLDVARVPSFGLTKNRAELIVDLQTKVAGLAVNGATEKFVTTGGPAAFILGLQQAVNDWFTSAGIAVDDPKIQEDGRNLVLIIDGYKKALGTSISKQDATSLQGFVSTLTNSKTQVNPIDILQNIITTNTAGGIVTFGTDGKYSFMNKLWELYKSSTLDLDPQIAPIIEGKISSRGTVFGLTPAQLTQLADLLKMVSRPPDAATAVGGPFFADDAKGAIRSAAIKDAGWGWTNQPFMDMTNSQIINQLAVLFVAPTFADFVSTYLQYLAANQDSLAELATSESPEDQAQVQRFVVRLMGLAEQWSAWSKAPTPRQQRQELNQFKTLVRAARSFVRTNPEMKARVEKLLATIQGAIDQLS